MRNIIIKHAEAKDWDAVIAVAWVTFQQIASQVSNEEAASAFREGLTSTQLYIEFLQGRYPVFCAYQNGKVVGVLAMSDETHISLLFVRRKFQRMGIGTGLLEQCMAYCRSKGGSEVTVNAISTGIPFYISSGFEVLGEERVEQGLRYIPMILKFKGR
jgi:GNAT superfamily N-acetyltransferase